MSTITTTQPRTPERLVGDLGPMDPHLVANVIAALPAIVRGEPLARWPDDTESQFVGCECFFSDDRTVLIVRIYHLHTDTFRYSAYLLRGGTCVSFSASGQ